MILLYDRFYYIIEFIKNNDWINSVACIFKDIANIAGWEKIILENSEGFFPI